MPSEHNLAAIDCDSTELQALAKAIAATEGGVLVLRALAAAPRHGSVTVALHETLPEDVAEGLPLLAGLVPTPAWIRVHGGVEAVYVRLPECTESPRAMRRVRR